MPLKEAPLATFLGDETFPIEWSSETERDLFWVFDDLHCPHPLSPMFEDIGGWWLTCDHMFRRFGTPFATDWIAKNINGYLYTAAIPAEAGRARSRRQEYGYEIDARRSAGPALPGTDRRRTSASCCPVYGARVRRLVARPPRPRDGAQLRVPRGDARPHGRSSASRRLAVLLEDAIDIHDRHWKIHWMLNFAQLSATLNLRAVMEETHGRVDDALLGRLQNSASDRNWDKIRALWEMKEEVKADPELARLFAAPTGAEIAAALKRVDRGRRFIDERVEPYQREFGWHAVWSHEFVFPTFREQAGAGRPARPRPGRRGLRLPDEDRRALPADIDAAADEILRRARGRGARRRCARRNEINLRMAPLTPDHHFYIDQGANAHLRLVLIAIGEKLVELGVLDAPDDVVFLFRYNELRAFIGDPQGYRRARDRGGGARGARARVHDPAARLGRDGHRDPARLPVPRQLGLPREVPPRPGRRTTGEVTGVAGSPGVVEGVGARRARSEAEFDAGRDRATSSCAR